MLTDDNISSCVTEIKMTVHIGDSWICTCQLWCQCFQLGEKSKNDCAYRRFINMCMAVTIIDEDISSYVREAEMTMDIRD